MTSSWRTACRSPRCTPAKACGRPRAARCGARRSPRPGSSSLLRKMERNASDDGVRPEEERALDEQRALVMQQMLPPFGRDELGKNYGHIVVGPLPLDFFDVLEERLHQ